MTTTRSSRRAAARAALPLGGLVGGLVGGLAAVLLGAAPASAHVTITPSSTAAGTTAVVRLVVPHGCEGAATSEVAVRMPDSVTEVDVESTGRWQAEASEDAITYRTDDPLPDGVEDSVQFSVRLPDDVGATLVFPVVQRCEGSEAAWTEVAADEASREELEMPAPVLVVTADAGAERLMTLGAAGVVAAGCVVAGGVLLLRRRRA